LSGYIFTTKTHIDNREKLVKQQYLLQMSPHNMVNFGPLAAEIGPVVWRTPGNFNGFRILAALTYWTVFQQWTSAKRCGLEQRAPPIFGKAAITLGIGRHSSSLYSSLFTLMVETIQQYNRKYKKRKKKYLN